MKLRPEQGGVFLLLGSSRYIKKEFLLCIKRLILKTIL